jgi:small multidrug resistance family-3 protein
MHPAITLLLLFCSALLEAGGDRLIRFGLHAPSSIAKGLFLLAGGIALFAYGYLVNTPPWDFGRLLSVYVVFFFMIAQAISCLEAHRWPSLPVLVGAAFIVTGGGIIAYAGAYAGK